MARIASPALQCHVPRHDIQAARISLREGRRVAHLAVPPARPQLENMAQYFGMVKCIDDNVGKILAVLDKLGTDRPHHRGVHGRSWRSVRRTRPHQRGHPPRKGLGADSFPDILIKDSS